MLEQLFGSRTRVKLLRLFLTNPQNSYFVRELTRKIGERINSVRRELDNLEKIGLISQQEVGQKKYYKVNIDHILYPELKSLLLKSQITLERNLARNLKSIGQVSYLALTGSFVGNKNTQTDILIVGKVNRHKLRRLVSKFKKDFDHQIRYTIMSRKEFDYRNNMTDRFLYTILENKRIVIIDKIFSK